MAWFGSPALLALALALAVLAATGSARTGYYTPRRRAAILALRMITVLCLAFIAGEPLLSASARHQRFAVLWDSPLEGAAERDRQAAVFIEGLRRTLPPGTPLAVTRFPERQAREDQAGADGGIEAELRSALAHFEAGDENRIILLSDGREAGGDALRAVPELQRIGARVFVHDLGSVAGADVRMERVSGPRTVVPGEQFQIKAFLAHEAGGRVTVELLRGGRSIARQEVTLEGRGEREIVFPETAEPEGSLRYRVALRGPDAAAPPLQERELDVSVDRAPSVLYLAGEPAESQPLVQLLRQAGLPVAVREPGAWAIDRRDAPGRLVVVLDNVSAQELGFGGMERLESLVRERGAGLLAIGGPGTFGAGDFGGSPLERALPVLMDAPAGAPERNLSLVIVLDASLSMYFHGRGRAAVHGGAVPSKIDAAKIAVLEMARALRPGDELGLLESKDRLAWVQPLGPLRDRMDFERRLRGIHALGSGIYFYSSILEARNALRASRLPLRMMMVVCDTNDVDQYRLQNLGDSAELVRGMAAEGITLSIFSIGFPSDKDVPFLRSMAALGRGDFYLVSNLTALPRYLRTEYAKKSGESIREEEFQPLVRDYHPLLQGIAAEFPALRAMHLLTPRRGSGQVLVAPFGAPLLADWRYGKGHTAVFTADSGARWATAWLSWPDAERFWRQLLFALAPRADAAPLEARARLEPDGRHVRFIVHRRGEELVETGFPTAVLERDGRRTELPLDRRGIDTYVAPLPTAAPGAYRFALRETPGGSDVTGGPLDLPSRAELARKRGGRPLLELLAWETGGAVIETPEEAVRTPARPRRKLPNLAFWLLPIGMLALFGEMTLRR